MDVQATILRQFPASVPTIGIAAGHLTSSAFEVRPYRHGQVHLPSSYIGGTATFLASTAQGGTFTPVKDSAGAAVAVPCGASRALTIPDSVMAGHWAKIQAAAKQTPTSGAATMFVVLKG